MRIEIEPEVSDAKKAEVSPKANTNKSKDGEFGS
jgi:hypothetical protein